MAVYGRVEFNHQQMHPKALLFPLSLHNLATFLKVFLSKNDPMRGFRDGWATVMVFQGWSNLVVGVLDLY